MSTNLAERRGPGKELREISKLEKVKREIIARLPSYSDEDLYKTRSSARQLYASAWKIEVACDAEIWDRAEKQLGGRGQADVEEKGIMAAVNKRAAELGCGASTIRKNAQIYQQFKTVLSAEQNILDDKGFFQAALSAPDPDEAIEMFTQKRLDNPLYRVADAYRDIEDEREKVESARRKVTAAIRSLERKRLAEHIEIKAIPTILSLQKKCPNTAFATVYWAEILRELRERLDDMQTADLKQAVLKAWAVGHQTGEQVSSFTGLPISEVRRIMKTLVRAGYFVEKELEWKPDNARGSRQKLWRRTQKGFTGDDE